MDHGYPFDAPIDGLSPELSSVGSRMASFLGAGGRAIVLTGPANSGKTAMMEHLLAGLSGHVTRVRGPGPGAERPTLDVAGMLRQMGEPAAEEGDATGLLLRTLAVAAYDEYSAVLAIDDAHALTAEALQVLARVPGLGGTVTPGMTLVLVGEPSLLGQLAAPGLEVFGNPRRTLIARVPAAPSMAAARGAWQVPVMHAHASSVGAGAGVAPAGWLARHGRDLVLVGGALAAGAALATVCLGWPGVRTAVPVQVAAPATLVPMPPPVTPAPTLQALVVAVPPVQTPVVPAPVVPPVVPGPVVPGPVAAAPAPAPAPVPSIVVMPFEPVQAGAVPASVPPSPSSTPVPAPTADAGPPSPAAIAEPDAPLPPAATSVPVVAAPVAADPPHLAEPAPPLLPEAPAVPAVPGQGAARGPVTEAQLRREFDAFLNRAGPDTAKLAPAARAGLWHEFLQWRVRKAGTRAPS